MPTAVIVWSSIAAVAVVMAVQQVLPVKPAFGHARTRRVESARLDRRDVPEWIGAQVLRAFGETLRVPRKDLALVGTSPAAHTGRQALYALAGLVFPSLVTVLMATVGAAPPIVVPVAVSLLCAVGFALAVDIEVRRKAARAREEFRYAAASFLERAALARAANTGAAVALDRTAAVGDGWALERIRAAIEPSRLSGTNPWDALRDLAEEIGVPELARPAETLALAGEKDASVYTTLRAQSRALRVAMLTDAKATANQASERLVVPVTGLAILFLIFIGYPAFARILTV